MLKPRHINAAVIKAWAEGQDIEYYSNHKNKWETYYMDKHFMHSVNAVWGPWNSFDSYKWRIAPKKVMIRHALLGSTVLCYTKNYSDTEDKVFINIENDPNITWLDDWHEASFGPENTTKE